MFHLCSGGPICVFILCLFFLSGCLATMDEEKEEILNLLTKTYPTHTKLEIVTLIFPFIQHLLDLEWCAEIKNGDIVVKPMLDAEDKDSNAKMRLHANKTSTFIRKSKVFVCMEAFLH